MTTPKRGVKVKIIPGTTRQDDQGRWKTEPARVVRVNKPRNGGGITLGVFSNSDGDGHQAALRYIEEKGHSLA
jgi:hypothetical protein